MDYIGVAFVCLDGSIGEEVVGEKYLHDERG
jgi:hypothetical protein